MTIETHIPLIENILSDYQTTLGDDYLGYKSHVYRMLNFCFALHQCTPEEKQKLIIAACFHDLGIWTQKTVDYLPPSIDLVKTYLIKNKLEAWLVEIELLIAMHHKLKFYQDNHYPLVELFRRGDLVDFSLGFIRFGLSKEYINSVKMQLPNQGFHRCLTRLAKTWFKQHPFKLPPFIKW